MGSLLFRKLALLLWLFDFFPFSCPFNNSRRDLFLNLL